MDSVLANDTSEDTVRWRGGPHIGYSPYTSIIGAELQRGNWGVTIGLPTSIGLRYYFDKKGYRWFLGPHFMYYTIDEEEFKDGIRYDEQSLTMTGLGMGYKWRWIDHLDLTLSLSLVYAELEYKNDASTRTDEGITFMPGLTFGYTF